MAAQDRGPPPEKRNAPGQGRISNNISNSTANLTSVTVSNKIGFVNRIVVPQVQAACDAAKAMAVTAGIEVDPAPMPRDIAELDQLAAEIKVCVTKSDNYADTARQKIATVAQALDAGEFGDWNTPQWLLLKVDLDAEKLPLYLPKPIEVATAAVEAEPHLSNRALAQKTGVSLDTVNRARNSTERNRSVDESRVGLDGKKRRPPAPKPAPKVERQPALQAEPVEVVERSFFPPHWTAEQKIEYQRTAIRSLILLLEASTRETVLLPQAVLDESLRQIAKVMGREIRFVEVEDQPTPAASGEPVVLEPAPAPTAAPDREQPSVAPPAAPAAASAEPDSELDEPNAIVDPEEIGKRIGDKLASRAFTQGAKEAPTPREIRQTLIWEGVVDADDLKTAYRPAKAEAARVWAQLKGGAR